MNERISKWYSPSPTTNVKTSALVFTVPKRHVDGHEAFRHFRCAQAIRPAGLGGSCSRWCQDFHTDLVETASELGRAFSRKPSNILVWVSEESQFAGIIHLYSTMGWLFQELHFVRMVWVLRRFGQCSCYMLVSPKYLPQWHRMWPANDVKIKSCTADLKKKTQTVHFSSRTVIRSPVREGQSGHSVGDSDVFLDRF